MKRLLVACAAIAAATYATAARADAPSGDKAAAQALFDKGRELVEKGRFGEACPKLAESQRLDPGLGTLLWLADCLENNGQTASAWASFAEAAALAHQAHDKRERIARDRSKKLEPRLSRLVIVVPQGAPEGLAVERDGTAIGSAVWGVPVPVDPGEHTITASAAGFARWSTTVQLPARPDTLHVTVPALEPEPPAPATAETPPPPAPPPPPPAAPAPAAPPPDATPASSTGAEAPPAAPASDRGDGQRTMGLAIAGLGVLSLGAGAYFSLTAKSTYDNATSSGHCNASNACDATGKQERSDAFSQATVATVTLAAGAAALAGGAVLYLIAPRGTPVRAALAPNARGGSAWMAVDW